MIGLLQITDGLLFYLQQQGALTIAYSYLQLSWFFVSLGALFLFDSDSPARRVPLLFLAYITLNVFLAELLFDQDESVYGYASPDWFSALTILIGGTIAYFGLKHARLSTKA